MRFSSLSCVVVTLLALGASALSAQERLIGGTTLSAGTVYEHWSFASAIATPLPSGGTAYVTGSSQLTTPVAVAMELVPGWTADVYSAYVRGEVRLASGANAAAGVGTSTYRVDGLTDTKLRLTGQLLGDALLFTAGATLPTGATRLSGEQLDAISVLSSPGLRFRSPGLGGGAGGTVGLIFARQIAGWGMALGSSYEVRGAYAPSEASQAGLTAGELRPGNATHLSLAGERVGGAIRQLVSVAADFHQQGEYRLDLASGSTNGADAFGVGPSVNGTYELDLTTRGTESAFFLAGRRRGDYRIGGTTVAGSARTEVDGGAQAARALSPTSAVRLAIDARYQSASAGLDGVSSITSVTTTNSTLLSTSSAATFSTAGAQVVGVTLGVRLGGARSGVSLEPFIRGQTGRLDFGTFSTQASGLAGGALLTARF